METLAHGWLHGDFCWTDWDAAADKARIDFANYIGVHRSMVATVSSLSEAAATVAGSVPAGVVVLAEDEFRSNLLPWWGTGRSSVRVARRREGVSRTQSLIEAIDSDVVLVAVSEVLSNDGERVDLAKVRQACADKNARLFVNLTQSLGVLNTDLAELDADYVAVHGYKWMLCPRGAAWLVVREDRMDEMTPLVPSWKTTGPPIGYFGGPYRQADDMSRCDAAPAWFSWIGARSALKLLASLGRGQVEWHCLRLAEAFTESAHVLGFRGASLGAPSHIVSVELGNLDPIAVNYALMQRKIKATVHNGRLRVGFHYFNSLDDVACVTELLMDLRSQY